MTNHQQSASTFVNDAASLSSYQTTLWGVANYYRIAERLSPFVVSLMTVAFIAGCRLATISTSNALTVIDLPHKCYRTQQHRLHNLDVGPGSSLGIGQRFGQCSGTSPGVRYEFVEGIRKLAENMLGDSRKKTVRLVVRIPEVVGLMKVRSLFSLMVIMVVIIES
ncbi:hypothetical protein B296_00030286 [Ensete ventricosum]|uniref:Uncharacterized protein n=1 Tax=Ensete ventricosum TaxID=4639 RepID=A0A426Y7I2_ENSVE|nr:hypothetical protein B296_00030286 [Ensete ventricosum]